MKPKNLNEKVLVFSVLVVMFVICINVSAVNDPGPLAAQLPPIYQMPYVESELCSEDFFGATGPGPNGWGTANQGNQWDSFEMNTTGPGDPVCAYVNVMAGDTCDLWLCPDTIWVGGANLSQFCNGPTPGGFNYGIVAAGLTPGAYDDVPINNSNAIGAAGFGWSSYDLVLDCDPVAPDGFFHPGFDALGDNDVASTAGFEIYNETEEAMLISIESELCTSTNGFAGYGPTWEGFGLTDDVCAYGENLYGHACDIWLCPDENWTDGGNLSNICSGALYGIVAVAPPGDAFDNISIISGTAGQYDLVMDCVNSTGGPSPDGIYDIGSDALDDHDVKPTAGFEIVDCVNIHSDDFLVDTDTLLCNNIFSIGDTNGNGIIIINANNVVLDCNGATINGTGSGIGINNTNGFNNVTIKNCNIYNFSFGIYFDNSNNGTIINNNVSLSGTGIVLSFSSDNNIVDNNASSNEWDGIDVHGVSNNNNITNNTASSNDMNGIYLGDFSEYNTLTDNTVNDNNGDGIYLENYAGNTNLNNNEIINNTYNGIYISLDSSGTEIYDNYICFNGYTTDIVNNNASTTGDGNTCNTTAGYSDINPGVTPCTNACGVPPTPTCGCDDGTYNYTCHETITTSCVMNCNLNSNGTCFTIGANDIIIDGNGYSITGNTTGDGIYANGRNNVTIKNFKIYNFSIGIYLEFSLNNTLTDNTANNNSGGDGIVLYTSSNNTVTDNTANNNGYNGIILYDFSNNNTVTDNTANNNGVHGIWLGGSSNNNIISNTMNDNNDDGIYLQGSNNNTVTSNTANSNKWGIRLDSSENNDILDNNASSNSARGIYLDSSSNNTITDNTANANGWYGVYMSSSTYNNITDNTVSSNSRYGIYLCSSSTNNNLTNNIANDNKWDGLRIYDSGSTDNTINSNTFCSNNQSTTEDNYYDLSDADSNSGDNNTCDTTNGYADPGTSNCTFKCEPEIESANSSGIDNNFLVGEGIHTYSNKLARTQVDICICIVNNRTWNDGDAFTGTCYTNTTDADGNLIYKYLYTAATEGYYDMIADIDCDNKYNAYRDAVDDLDIEGSGFYIYPEAETLVLFSFGLFVLYGFIRFGRKSKF